MKVSLVVLKDKLNIGPLKLSGDRTLNPSKDIRHRHLGMTLTEDGLVLESTQTKIKVLIPVTNIEYVVMEEKSLNAE